MAERAMKETNIFPPTIFPILQRDEKCKRKYCGGQNSKQRILKPPEILQGITFSSKVSINCKKSIQTKNFQTDKLDLSLILSLLLLPQLRLISLNWGQILRIGKIVQNWQKQRQNVNLCPLMQKMQNFRKFCTIGQYKRPYTLHLFVDNNC